MKKSTLVKIIKECYTEILAESKASEQAHKLGLISKGWGKWYDKSGKFVAKTQGDKLVKVSNNNKQKYKVPVDLNKKSNSLRSTSMGKDYEDPDDDDDEEQNTNSEVNTSDIEEKLINLMDSYTSKHKEKDIDREKVYDFLYSKMEKMHPEMDDSDIHSIVNDAMENRDFDTF